MPRTNVTLNDVYVRRCEELIDEVVVAMEQRDVIKSNYFESKVREKASELFNLKEPKKGCNVHKFI